MTSLQAKSSHARQRELGPRVGKTPRISKNGLTNEVTHRAKLKKKCHKGEPRDEPKEHK
jgi:hypothetical protein